MSTTLHFLSLTPENEALFIAAQEADAAYWELIGKWNSTPAEELRAADRAQASATDAWYEARVAMNRNEQLPILEASHRDTEPCELLTIFEHAENFIITVSDSNIQELADAWEDSNDKRTFTLILGKGTVYSWLMDNRGQKITVSS